MDDQVGADPAGSEVARRSLIEACALWSLDLITSEQVVVAATDALVADLDSQSLRVLAGTPKPAATIEVPELFPRVMAELGLPFFDRGGAGGRLVSAQAMARGLLTGAVSPRDLVARMHRVFGHDAHELIEPLVDLDDVYDTLEYASDDEADVEQRVVAAARRLLAADAGR
jgi:hypothetical protein